MNQSYELWLVALSLLVSFLGSLTGLKLAARARTAEPAVRRIWIAASAVALGAGAIWSMHFLAMLALEVGDVTIRYDLELTLLSLAVAIAFTLTGMTIVARHGVSLLPICSAGTLMGFGIAGMHYTGMSAMNVHAQVEYDAVLVAVSVAIAILASSAALWLAFSLRTRTAEVVGAIAMAAAIAGMHYTGMAALKFGDHVHIPAGPDLSGGLSPATMAAAVALATNFVLAIGLLAVFFDRRGADERRRQLGALEVASASEARWRKTLDSIPQLIWLMSGDGRQEYYNAQWHEFLGVDLEEPGAKARSAFVHPDDHHALVTWQTCLVSGTDYEAEYRLRHKTGQYRWVMSRGSPERDDQGNVVRWYGTCTDIHDKVLAEEQVRRTESLTRAIVEATPDCISVLDYDGNVVFANYAVAKAYGLDNPSGLIGKPWGHLHTSQQSERSSLLAGARTGQTQRATLLAALADGAFKWWDAIVAPVRNPGEGLAHFVVCARNITHQKNVEDAALWAAGHDSLTGLANRAFLQERLEQMVSTGSLNDESFGLLLIDIDDFKQINDTLGHDAGDALLIAVAERLSNAGRAEDLVARLGGDEFAVVLPGAGTEEAVTAAGDKILHALKTPWVHSGALIDCRASIGASIFPKDGSDKAELLKSADIALYVAKVRGGSRVASFSADMRDQIQKKASMLSLARDALADDLIQPFYQPKVDLTTRIPVGFEALLRWRHPNGGIQLPASIKAAFDDPDIGAEMSERMLIKVIDDMRRWLNRGIDFGHIALNAAANDFRRGGYAELVLERLEKASIPASRLQIEVTETVFLGKGAGYVEKALEMLRANGIRIALDDFGTGYASLSHLKQFPLSIIKIDRSFIHDLESNPDDAAIVRAIIRLGRNLDLEVVGEGIETAAQEAMLGAQGCTHGQGYLYSRAMPYSQVSRYIASASSPSVAA